MGSIEYLESSARGRISFGIFFCACVVIYYFSDIYSYYHPTPDLKLLQIQAVDRRNLISAYVTTGFGFFVTCYAVNVAVMTQSSKQFPYPSMLVPIRLRIHQVQKDSTIWLLVSVVVLSVVLQLLIVWYTWYKWHELLISTERLV